MNTTSLLFPLAGYLLGAIPFGLIIGLLKGVDVRKAGSGNIGSTNVGRLLGKKWGYLCFFLDVAKGLLPVLVAGYYLKRTYVGQGEIIPRNAQLLWLAVAAGCILGHMFSLYLGFKGGKGVATSLGVILGIWPYFTLTGLVVFGIWLVIWAIWRYVSLASIIAALAFPAVFTIFTALRPAWSLAALWPLLAFSVLIAVLVVIRHRSNIRRLLAGTEARGRPR